MINFEIKFEDVSAIEAYGLATLGLIFVSETERDKCLEVFNEIFCPKTSVLTPDYWIDDDVDKIWFESEEKKIDITFESFYLIVRFYQSEEFCCGIAMIPMSHLENIIS